MIMWSIIKLLTTRILFCLDCFNWNRRWEEEAVGCFRRHAKEFRKNDLIFESVQTTRVALKIEKKCSMSRHSSIERLRNELEIPHWPIIGIAVEWQRHQSSFCSMPLMLFSSSQKFPWRCIPFVRFGVKYLTLFVELHGCMKRQNAYKQIKKNHHLDEQ